MNDCRITTGGYRLDGTLHPGIGLAVQYLEGQGFTKGEALEYIKSLPLEE